MSGILSLEQSFLSDNVYVNTTARASFLCPAFFPLRGFLFQSFSFDDEHRHQSHIDNSEKLDFSGSLSLSLSLSTYLSPSPFLSLSFSLNPLRPFFLDFTNVLSLSLSFGQWIKKSVTSITGKVFPIFFLIRQWIRELVTPITRNRFKYLSQTRSELETLAPFSEEVSKPETNLPGLCPASVQTVVNHLEARANETVPTWRL